MNHLEAIGDGSIQELYKFSRPVPILVLCEELGAMKALQESLKDDIAFEDTEDHFLFRLYDPVDALKPEAAAPTNTKKQTRTKIKTLLDGGFAKGWQTYTGKKKVLFR